MAAHGTYERLSTDITIPSNYAETTEQLLTQHWHYFARIISVGHALL